MSSAEGPWSALLRSGPSAWDHLPARPLYQLGMTSGSLLHLSSLSFPMCQMGTVTVPASYRRQDK